MLGAPRCPVAKTSLAKTAVVKTAAPKYRTPMVNMTSTSSFLAQPLPMKPMPPQNCTITHQTLLNLQVKCQIQKEAQNKFNIYLIQAYDATSRLLLATSTSQDPEKISVSNLPAEQKDMLLFIRTMDARSVTSDANIVYVPSTGRVKSSGKILMAVFFIIGEGSTTFWCEVLLVEKICSVLMYFTKPVNYFRVMKVVSVAVVMDIDYTETVGVIVVLILSIKSRILNHLMIHFRLFRVTRQIVPILLLRFNYNTDIRKNLKGAHYIHIPIDVSLIT